jgi:hypothetical protein
MAMVRGCRDSMKDKIIVIFESKISRYGDRIVSSFFRVLADSLIEGVSKQIYNVLA